MLSIILFIINIFFLQQGYVLRQNQNDDIRARMVLPSVNDPNVLVLQGVKKAARGNYSCKVGNGIPSYNYEVESKPVFLDVKCKYFQIINLKFTDIIELLFRKCFAY